MFSVSFYSELSNKYDLFAFPEQKENKFANNYKLKMNSYEENCKNELE